jgi:ABC-type uncharacterized transport system fused permease/ATPase subunit
MLKLTREKWAQRCSAISWQHFEGHFTMGKCLNRSLAGWAIKPVCSHTLHMLSFATWKIFCFTFLILWSNSLSLPVKNCICQHPRTYFSHGPCVPQFFLSMIAQKKWLPSVDYSDWWAREFWLLSMHSFLLFKIVTQISGIVQQWVLTMLSTHGRHLCSIYRDAPTMDCIRIHQVCIFISLLSSSGFKNLAVYFSLSLRLLFQPNLTDEIHKNYLRAGRFSHLSLCASAGPGQHDGTAAQMTIKRPSPKRKNT